MRRRDRKTTSHMSVGWRLWRLKPKCQCVIYSWCLSLISPEDVPPRASPDLHPQHTHQLSSHTIFPFYSSSFLVDKEQALPGGLRLFLTFTSLVRYPSIRLSLSLVHMCFLFCFPAGFSSSPSFFSACTWAREQLCLFLLPTSTTQQPIRSVLKSPGSEKVGWKEGSKERR